MTTARGAGRREKILDSAAELFATSGYAAVGMDQIGAATGITGPAIYRHFDSKAAVLAAVFDGIIDAVTAPAPPPMAQGAAAELAGLVGVYASAVAERRHLMAVFVREVHHLPPEHRIGLEARQRAMIRQWRTLLSHVHQDWSAEQVRTTVHGCFGLLNSVGTFSSPLSDDELAGLLRMTAARVLGLTGYSDK